MDKLIPIRFDGLLKTGGSTKPWVVFAIRDGEQQPDETPYVVKLFTADNVKQQPCIAKEFIGNHLAGEFDLQVPHAGIIDLGSEDFQATLDPDTLKILSGKHVGTTFASRLVDGTLVNDQLRNSFTNMIDLASIFAFDCLILNIDRGGIRNKPNLLMDDEGFILIDHELSLYLMDDRSGKAFHKVIGNFNKNTTEYLYEKHLFYPRLKNYKGNKKILFNSFEESLKQLNLYGLKELLYNLNKSGIDIGASNFLIDYLRILKQDPTKFCKILLGIIS